MEKSLKSIQASFESIGRLLNKLDDIRQDLGYFTHFEYENDSFEKDFKIETLEVNRDGAENNIEHELYNINVRMQILFEINNLPSVVKEVRDIFESNKYKTIDYFSYADIFYSPKLHKYELLFDILSDISNTNEASLDDFKLSSLHKLLESTGYIVSQNDILPKSENDLQKLMFSYISSFYPSTIRESPFPKPIGNYRPDFAIKNLKTCIEFKYVTSKKEARKILGSLFEDIHAYGGSKDWTNFIAVIYINGPLQFNSLIG